MRSRYAHNTSSTARSGRLASVELWSGVSMITSCARTPFILSNSPAPSRSRSPSMPSAGNLLGTTRMLHPGVFLLPSLRPYTRISVGVLDSCPGQKGQFLPLEATTLSRRNSLGRLPRSVEIMTQRPVIGSFRNSGKDSSSTNYYYRASAYTRKLRVAANAIGKLYRDCADGQLGDGPDLRCGWYRHLGQQRSENYLERRNCWLKASLCSLISGGRPGILLMASTSKRVGQSFRWRLAKKSCAVRTRTLCLA